jgi:methyl-accepting chemotaxis protein
MKLETRLGLSSGMLILAMFISAVVASISLQEANRLSSNVDNGRLPAIQLARDIRYQMINSARALESGALFGIDPAASEDFRKMRRESIEAAEKPVADLLELSGQFDLGEDAPAIRTMQSDLAQFAGIEEQIERLNDLHTPQSSRLAHTLLRTRVVRLDFAMFASLKHIIVSQQGLCQADTDRLHQAHRTILLTLWTTTVLGVFIGGLVSLLLARRITRGVGLVADRANAIASGNLTGAPLNIDSTDQIGSLARAMQQMQTSLRHIISMVAQSSNSLTASAISMSAANDHIHRRVDRQTQQTQQAATAMQEMSASIAEVSRHAQSAAETARSAARTAHEGGEIVTQMLSSMHSIATAVSDTSSTIGLLGEDSRRISQIVTVIDDIATKTNLLALNAAIEAARAGDHGRGFAIVAGEVRHLAESTAQATGEIAAMIQQLQQRTRTAIASMASGTLTVEQGVATTNRAGGALERIIGIAERVDRMIAQIAIAASQQANAADQSSSSLDSIHTLSIDNLSEMATTTNGIESLRATAAALASQVESFQLDLPQPGIAIGPASTGSRALPHPSLA